MKGWNMIKYRIRSSESGSSVDMLTGNRGWVEVVAFTNEQHRQSASAWVQHSEYLDQLDNA